MNLSVARALLIVVAILFSTLHATAQPPNFTGRYRILEMRTLGLTHLRPFVLQDGTLVEESVVNRNRPYCRAGQAVFDDLFGAIEVRFQTGARGIERAILQTVPSVTGLRSTQIVCVAETGFATALDLTIAFGRVVELQR